MVARYSGAKKSSNDTLKDNLLNLIKLDRYYAIKAPLWIASVARFRLSFFDYFRVLDTRNNNIVGVRGDQHAIREDGGEDDDDENDGDETALEKEIREALELNTAKLLQRLLV